MKNETRYIFNLGRATVPVILTVFALILLVLVGPTVGFILAGNTAAAAVIGTATLAIILSLTHYAAYRRGGIDAHERMVDGADLMTANDESIARYNERAMGSLGRVFQQGARAGRTTRIEPATPELLLPPSVDDLGDWIDDVETYNPRLDD